MGRNTETNEQPDEQLESLAIRRLLRDTHLPAVSTDYVAARFDIPRQTAEEKLHHLHAGGQIERGQLSEEIVLWWVDRPIDKALDDLDPDTILKRVSDEIATPILLGDNILYENGDKHLLDVNTDREEDETRQFTGKKSASLVPSQQESGEKRQELKDGATLEEASDKTDPNQT